MRQPAHSSSVSPRLRVHYVIILNTYQLQSKGHFGRKEQFDWDINSVEGGRKPGREIFVLLFFGNVCLSDRMQVNHREMCQSVGISDRIGGKTRFFLNIHK